MCIKQYRRAFTKKKKKKKNFKKNTVSRYNERSINVKNVVQTSRSQAVRRKRRARNAW